MFRASTTAVAAIALTAVCTVGLAAPAQANHDPQGTCTKEMGVTTCTLITDLGKSFEKRFTGESCVEEVDGEVKTGLEYEWMLVDNHQISTTKYRGHKQVGPTEYSLDQQFGSTGGFGCQLS